MGQRDPVQHALELARAGKKDQAHSILKNVLAKDKNNIRALAALAYVAQSRPEAISYLQQVLKHNPGDEWATKVLALLDDKPSGVPAPDSSIPFPTPPLIANNSQPTHFPPPPLLAAVGPSVTSHRKRRRQRPGRSGRAFRRYLTRYLAGVTLALLLVSTVILVQIWNRPLGPSLVTQVALSGAAAREAAEPGSMEQPSGDPLSAPTMPLAVSAPVGNPVCGGPPVANTLLIGSDIRGNSYPNGRSDVIRVVRVDFVTPSVTLLSIPRDLWVTIPGLERFGIFQNRVNTAYVYGNLYGVPTAGGGPSLLFQTLAYNFGLQVDHYVAVSPAVFEAGINAIGGIDVFVPQTIGTPQSAVYFPAGQQHMDGQKALEYARVRYVDNDLQRIQRQTQIIRAVADRTYSPQIIPRLPTLVRALQDDILTDMSPSQLFALMCVGEKIDASAVQTLDIDYSMVTSSVTPEGAQVLLPDYGAIARVVLAFNTGYQP